MEEECEEVRGEELGKVKANEWRRSTENKVGKVEVSARGSSGND